MKSIAWITLYSAALVGLASCGKEDKGPLATIEQAIYERQVSSWPDKSKEVAKAMIDKYGPPNESTDSMIMWHNNGDWKHTVVYRDPVDHYFPKPHQDVIKQTVDFKVPVEKASELLTFYGGLLIDRTKGELSARSECEEMNILALNLAFDVMSNKKTAAVARKEFSKTAIRFTKGKSTDYLETLKFQTQKNASDPDQVYVKKAKAAKAQSAVAAKPPASVPVIVPKEN